MNEIYLLSLTQFESLKLIFLLIHSKYRILAAHQPYISHLMHILKRNKSKQHLKAICV